MPRHSYHERDYAVGQVMLKLRTSLGLTQAGLGVSRRAVGEWEGGLTYPKAHHLQHLIELCVRASVFTPEQEEEEIRALWKTAHQRVLLDERWLLARLSRSSAAPTPVEEAGGAAAVRASPAIFQLSPRAETPVAHAGAEPAVSRRVHWVGALDVSHFAGRRKRSAAIIEQSALVGKIGQWENPLLCSLRDGLIPLAFATLLPRLFGALVSLPS